MALFVDDRRFTGVPFIDDSHPAIATTVNAICDEIEGLNDLSTVLRLIDSLIIQVDHYLKSKNHCRRSNSCTLQKTDNETFHRLIDIRSMLDKYGHTVPRSVAIDEIKQWARMTVFENDAICQQCKCIPTLN